MKTIDKASRKFSMICVPTLLIGVTFLLSASPAQARDFAGVRAGYHAGYGFGYGDIYGYPVASSAVVVAPVGSHGPSLPPGAVVTLPAGAAPVVVFGKKYYFANGNYYSPVFYGGSVVYVPENP